MLLRIFFSGLIAFVSSNDGKELTVLLIKTPAAHHGAATAGGEEHKPLLLARAGACAPNCARTNLEVARFLFPGISDARSTDSLALAIDQGVVWQLSDSQLELGIPRDGVELVRSVSPDKPVPDNDVERADFGWVPSLKRIDPCISQLQPSVLGDNPPADLIVARLTLTSGKVSTHSLIRVKNDEVTPIDFRPLSGKGAVYTRAAANWVKAEIEIPGDSLQLTQVHLATGKKQTVTLTPRDGVVEMAILNSTSPTLGRQRGTVAGPGTHFARFWDLALHPPAAIRRAIPQVPLRQVATRQYRTLHANVETQHSPLLNAVFPFDRTTYDALLCPMSQVP